MKVIIAFFLSVFFGNTCLAQSGEHIKEMSLTLIPKTKRIYTEADNNKNEYELILSGLFLGYKHFVSSQDASSCSFTPSCSEYAILAIKEQGIIIGIINFFDRFSRCNGQSPEQYEYNEEAHLLIDPVRDIHHNFPENK